MSQEVYERYHAMQNTIDSLMAETSAICSELKMQDCVSQLGDARKMLKTHRFSVGILGEFRRGKSTFINSLLGDQVLPADIVPCTATLNRVTWGDKSAEILMKDGTVLKIPYRELNEYVTKITEESEKRAEEVDSAIVYYPCKFCENGVDIYDTPGLNDSERMTKITTDVIPKLDAIVMILVQESPFSASEADFVRTKLMTSDAGRMIFVLNKSDLIDPDDLDRLLVTIRERIRTRVINRTKQIYGDDAEEVAEIERKLSDIVVIPYSGKNALKGQQKEQDNAGTGKKLMESSGYNKLDQALTHMLVDERGMLEIAKPYNLVVRTVASVQSGIQTRLAALNRDAEGFKKQKLQSMETIKLQREAKDEEKNRLSKARERLGLELESDVNAFYEELKKKAYDIVDETITGRSLNESADELTKKLGNNVQACIENEVAFFGERTLSRMSRMIDAEYQKTEVVLNSLEEAMKGISSQIISGSVPSSGILAGTVADVATDFLGVYGLGGFISGYRTAGIKGALVGGVSGGTAMFATTILLGAIGFASLPVIVGGCLVGAVVGKLVPGAVFKKDKAKREAEQIRKNAKAQICKGIDEMKEEGQLDAWAKETLETRMIEIINVMDKACEQSLRETEEMLQDIETQLKDTDDARKTAREGYDTLLARCNEVVKSLEPVRDYITSITEN